MSRKTAILRTEIYPHPEPHHPLAVSTFHRNDQLTSLPAVKRPSKMVLVDKQEVLSAEERRLQEDRERTKYWKRFGPYTAERQWATVREDYS